MKLCREAKTHKKLKTGSAVPSGVQAMADAVDAAVPADVQDLVAMQIQRLATKISSSPASPFQLQMVLACVLPVAC